MAIRSGLFKQELFKTDSDGDKTRTSWWTSTETVDIDEGMDNKETALVDATSWDTTYDTASTQPTGLTNFISKVTTFFKNVKFLKNRVDTMNTSLQQGIDSANTNANGRVSKTGDTMSGDLLFADSNTTTRQIRGVVGTNDYWRVAGGATAANGGWMEIATADDGNEPIYARQYSGNYVTVTREAKILDGSGNSSFPGTLNATTLQESGQALSAKYQAKGNYATASSVYTKTESDNKYLLKANVSIKEIPSKNRIIAPGISVEMGRVALDAGTYVITHMTSWTSGVQSEAGKGVGHSVTTGDDGAAGLNNTAVVCIPYGYINNTRVCGSTIYTFNSATTIKLVAKNRTSATMTCDGCQLQAIRIK